WARSGSRRSRIVRQGVALLIAGAIGSLVQALGPLLSRLRVLAPVLRDFRFQVGVLLARKKAERIKHLQLLLGPSKIAHLQVCLAEILVRALVLRIDRQ